MSNHDPTSHRWYHIPSRMELTDDEVADEVIAYRRVASGRMPLPALGVGQPPRRTIRYKDQVDSLDEDLPYDFSTAGAEDDLGRNFQEDDSPRQMANETPNLLLPEFKDQVNEPNDKSRKQTKSVHQVPVAMAEQIVNAVEANNRPHEPVTATPLSRETMSPSLSLRRTRIIARAAIIIIGMIVVGAVVGVIFGGKRPTAAPAGPTRSFKVFQTTQELYRAVDLYMVDKALTLEYGNSISDWDVSLIRVFDRLFDANRNSTLCFSPKCPSYHFNEDLNSWNMSSAESLFAMFYEAENFNGDISSWDVSHVTNASKMFAVARSFNQDIRKWNVSSLTDARCMFCNANSFDKDLCGWRKNLPSTAAVDRMFLFANSCPAVRDVGVTGYTPLVNDGPYCHKCI